ncbi:MAG TPA: hypothetical protein VGN18_07630 [Jatrophihabitans sp.]|jgi:hypothetical protein|uniref:hypothetical protein n=1 Tax=Jatrophihabitans sp. TaxID=1932789 RepID=UPI002E09B265|nr:hypothetical protein [Jatrophihabitans sp.]
MLRGSVLLLALVFAFPTIWAALVDHTITVDTAVVRFLVALPVAAVLLALVRMATRDRDPR